MAGIEGFAETSDVQITVLVDNVASLMARGTETVKRYREKPLLAEHGFAAFLHLKEARQQIIWDAGITETALLENAAKMGIDLSLVDAIALSHGHRDHAEALTGLLHLIVPRLEAREWQQDITPEEIEGWIESQRVPLVAHPACFRERWSIAPDGRRFGPRRLPRAEWEAAGADIVETAEPYKLAPGCWTTGEIPRRSFERAGTSPRWVYRAGGQFIRDYVPDDQAIVINVRDKGLVILSGCAHSGVVNTVHHARHISGVDNIWAILGGFHLGRAEEDDIERTIDAITALEPRMVVPSHCTGWEATVRFAERMPGQFVQGTVGTTYLF